MQRKSKLSSLAPEILSSVEEFGKPRGIRKRNYFANEDTLAPKVNLNTEHQLCCLG